MTKIYAGSTVRATLTLSDVSGPPSVSEVQMTLTGPTSFTPLTRTLTGHTITDEGAGLYSAKFLLGDPGYYKLVAQATSTAGDKAPDSLWFKAVNV